MSEMTPIPEDRPLSSEECRLVKWLLEHGNPDAIGFLHQLEKARVVSRCPCGCPSVDFAIDGRTPAAGVGMNVLSDYYWEDSAGHAFGVFAYACGELLSGLEVWSADGLGENCKLPLIEELKPLIGK